MKSALMAGVALVLGCLVTAAEAQAGVIYQSVPDLTVAPIYNTCSQCNSNGQNVGQFIPLSSGAVATSLSFVVAGWYVWPTPVTVDLFKDAPFVLGANVFHQTFSTFASDIPTGNGTDVVTVSLPNLLLPAGDYDLFLTNTTDLGIAVFGGPGGILTQTHGQGGPGPASGDFNGGHAVFYAAGVELEGTAAAAPEPASWAMMLIGLCGLGGTLRARRTRAA